MFCETWSLHVLKECNPKWHIRLATQLRQKKWHPIKLGKVG